MTEKNEALRLADLWERHSHGYTLTPEANTAAELRRLSAVEAQRDALLALLKEALDVCIWPGAMITDLHERACAAIKAVEGEQK